MQDWGRCRLVIRLGLTMSLLVALSACNHLSQRGVPEAPVASLVLGSGAEATSLELAEQQLNADIRDQMLRVRMVLTFRAPDGKELVDGLFRLHLPPTASVSSFAVSTDDGGRIAAQVVERRRADGFLRALEEKDRPSARLTPVASGLFEVRLGRFSPQRSLRLALTYTEFLPLQNGRYACSLPRAPAGVSETLRLTVHSGTPLRRVGCSLAAAEIRHGPTSALIDYRGTGGSGPLQVTVSPELPAAPLVACGYEQGGDGFFLLLANAPSGSLTGLRLEANGLSVAALYPQSLADLASGGQLVVLGRYQPPRPGAAANLVLHGLRGGQPVRLETPLRRTTGEDGLSFIPRLWAQRHLAALLTQPQTEDLVAEVVELSEEYSVLTPYTTFLVLDSENGGTDGIGDQGLRRRLRPSNGAWFFAEGKERARLDTLRQQQRVADDAWTEFRLEALRPLFGLRSAWNQPGKPVFARPRPPQHDGSPTLGRELRLLAAVTAWDEMDRAVAQAAAQPLPPAVPPRPEPLPGKSPRRIDRLGGGGRSANWQEPPPAAGELLGLPRGEPWLLGNRRWTEPIAGALEPPKPAGAVLPSEISAVTRRLLCLPRLTGPVLIDLVNEQWGAQPKGKATERRARLLLAPGRWLVVQDSLSKEGSNQPKRLQWHTAKDRGVLVASRGFGVSRAPLPTDAVPVPVRWFWGSFRDLPSLHTNGEEATVQRVAEDRLRLTFGGPGYGCEYLIDPVRRVVLRRQDIDRSLPQSTSLFVLSDFVEAGGCWWPGQMEWRTSGNAMEQRTTFTVRALDAVAFERLWAEAFGDPKESLVLPFPSAPRRALISAWKERVLTVPQRYALLRHFVDTAQWAAAEKQRGALANAGVPELALQEARDAIVLGTQGSEEWLARLLGRAQRLVAEPQPDELALALPWLSQARRTVGAEEQLRLIDAVTPIFSRQPQWMQSERRLRRLRAAALQAAGRRAEAAALRAQKDEKSSATPILGGMSGPLGFGVPYRQDLAALDAQVLAYGLPAGRRDAEAEAHLYQYCETQIRRGRPAAALAMLGEWRQHLARVPEALPGTQFGALGYNGHYYYLLAMGRDGREDDAFALAAAWLKRPVSSVALSPREQAEAKAAVRFAFAGPWSSTPPYVDSRLDDLLLKTAVAALRRPDLEWFVSSIAFGGSWGYWGGREALRTAQLAWEKEKGEARRPPSAHPMAPFWEFLAGLRREGLAEEAEGPALAMVAALNPLERGERAMASRVDALAQVVDAMVQSRFARRLHADLEARRLVARDPEAASADALRQARVEVAERLRAVAGSIGPALLPWLVLERQWLELLAGSDAEALAAGCWQALGASPPRTAGHTWLQALPMAQRLTMLKRLCLAGRLPPEQVEALLAYLARGAAQEPQARVWKLHQLSLLLALDRQDELETRLTAWVRDDPAEPTWRFALGYLLARRNRLAEAIVQFETAAEPFGLPAREARLLSAWRILVAPAPEPVAVAPPPLRPDFARLSLQDLHRLLMADAARTGLALTAAETREILLRLAHHAQWRHEVFGLLATAYGRNRDPRLLVVVADLLRDAQLPEPFVLAKEVRGLLSRLNDVAVVGALGQAVREAIPGLTGERLFTADLLDLVCAPMLATAGRLKATELEQTVARLERVAAGSRERGSLEALASLLLDWGTVAAGPLRQAQTRWLAELMADQKVAQAPARRSLRLAYGKLLWSCEQRDDALRILEVALADPIDSPGSHPYVTRDPVLDTALGYLRETAQFQRCESMLRTRLEQAAESGEKARLEADLAALWVQALSGRQALHAGTGQVLYDAAHRQLRTWLDTAAGLHFTKLFEHLCALHVAAHREGCTDVPERLEELSQALPAMLAAPLVGCRVQDAVGTVAAARHQILGPRAALDFLLGWIEHEPRRLRYENDEGWDAHAEAIAAWKREIGPDAPLDRRLGALACRELRLFLHRDHENWQPALHYQRAGLLFREDFIPDFAAAAEAECRANPAADFVAMQAAHYLAVELKMPDRAAAVLAEAESRGRLGLEGRLERVRYTLAADQAAEAATLARRLATDLAAVPLGLFVELELEVLDVQALWLEALGAADDGPGFSVALAAIETGLSKQDARSLKAVTRLAQTCLGCGRFADAVRLFEDALVLHRLTAALGKESPSIAALEKGLQAARAGGK